MSKCAGAIGSEERAETLTLTRAHVTSSYAEHHSRHFAEESSEANDSGDPHAIKVTFNFRDSRTCSDWLEVEVSR